MKWQMLMEVDVEDINKVEAGGYGWAEGTRVADMGEGQGCGWKIINKLVLILSMLEQPKFVPL